MHKKSFLLLCTIIAAHHISFAADVQKKGEKNKAIVHHTVEKPAGITAEIESYIQRTVQEQVTIQIAEQAKRVIEEQIAFIDVNKVFEAQEMRDGMASLEKNFAAKVREKEELAKKIVDKNDALNKMAQGLGEGAREERIQEIAMLKAKHDTMARSIEQNGQMALEQLRMKGLKSMQEAVEKVASNEGRAYVFGGGLIKGSKMGDITETVLKTMNTTYVAQNNVTSEPDKKAVVAQNKETSKSKAATTTTA
jgi:Skp family chaperone for outer membrane proteins